MRFFLISYQYTLSNSSSFGFGEASNYGYHFPSRNMIFEKIKDKSPDVNAIVIINIMEFKNEADLKSYRS